MTLEIPSLDIPPLTTPYSIIMSRHGAAYQEACNFQKDLIKRRETVADKFAGTIARSWLDLEYFKREVRGLPRLKPAEAIAMMKRLRPAPAARNEPLEITATVQPAPEQGISFSEPVPTPPTPLAPSAADEE